MLAVLSDAAVREKARESQVSAQNLITQTFPKVSAAFPGTPRLAPGAGDGEAVMCLQRRKKWACELPKEMDFVLLKPSL